MIRQRVSVPIATVIGIFIVAFVLCWLMACMALAADAPKAEPGHCAAVRAGVATHGLARAIAWARGSGYTEDQIAAARRCLMRRRAR